MKLISLNTWGGKAGNDRLLSFFKRYPDVDFFCLQEVWNGGDEMVGVKAGGSPLVGISTTMLTDIDALLKDHSVYFRPHFKDYYGLAMFVRNNLEITEEGDIFVYKEKGYIHEGDAGNHARNIQYATYETQTGVRTVINFHGLWNGKGKEDSEERLLQTDNIIRFLQSLKNPFVVCGDFNLLPETESLKKFEDLGLRNLIKEFGITSTRTSFYTKPSKFADYVFVSEGIAVNEFKVLPDEVSDHSPLYLDFE
ncbi:hypothetical protein A3C91_04855 [Candidatus Azambacteria bacterium RIFCSPHIGHO2_02_FULL_52_12]|uniref:Endonuclease/exonuclease/phosphatase domain-containing protein n=1 Tax=Candidatus Azambacteria bacterium RIFCSPLOWO2_01_FULL_46_25 TaxID=1797298 RepID=A0A1F5BVS9_9BACT|nr:MAG: hypothetical protein A3C91_04855 [Candidatus Azambacteria bacterium RIFCSPHIGHO2_02_FULL_52_12]OGD34723.1 MAG: hypothetical protein A2988_04470 [Candidatus Azambacteria bacterium RIFCSPLOWO2_01_FULL_46_25]OGD37004.1 MAG: hypothetical protein A2850_03745 [Candidatus Azambacteria bacterium RIFCSPHIGHO2_01_FULL_51_74]